MMLMAREETIIPAYSERMIILPLPEDAGEFSSVATFVIKPAALVEELGLCVGRTLSPRVDSGVIVLVLNVSDELIALPIHAPIACAELFEEIADLTENVIRLRGGGKLPLSANSSSPSKMFKLPSGAALRLRGAGPKADLVLDDDDIVHALGSAAPALADLLTRDSTSPLRPPPPFASPSSPSATAAARARLASEASRLESEVSQLETQLASGGRPLRTPASSVYKSFTGDTPRPNDGGSAPPTRHASSSSNPPPPQDHRPAPSNSASLPTDATDAVDVLLSAAILVSDAEQRALNEAHGLLSRYPTWMADPLMRLAVGTSRMGFAPVPAVVAALKSCTAAAWLPAGTLVRETLGALIANLDQRPRPDPVAVWESAFEAACQEHLRQHPLPLQPAAEEPVPDRTRSDIDRDALLTHVQGLARANPVRTRLLSVPLSVAPSLPLTTTHHRDAIRSHVSGAIGAVGAGAASFGGLAPPPVGLGHSPHVSGGAPPSAPPAPPASGHSGAPPAAPPASPSPGPSTTVVDRIDALGLPRDVIREPVWFADLTSASGSYNLTAVTGAFRTWEAIVISFLHVFETVSAHAPRPQIKDHLRYYDAKGFERFVSHSQDPHGRTSYANSRGTFIRSLGELFAFRAIAGRDCENAASEALSVLAAAVTKGCRSLGSHESSRVAREEQQLRGHDGIVVSVQILDRHYLGGDDDDDGFYSIHWSNLQADADRDKRQNLPEAAFGNTAYYLLTRLLLAGESHGVSSDKIVSRWCRLIKEVEDHGSCEAAQVHARQVADRFCRQHTKITDKNALESAINPKTGDTLGGRTPLPSGSDGTRRRVAGKDNSLNAPTDALTTSVDKLTAKVEELSTQTSTALQASGAHGKDKDKDKDTPKKSNIPPGSLKNLAIILREGKIRDFAGISMEPTKNPDRPDGLYGFRTAGQRPCGWCEALDKRLLMKFTAGSAKQMLRSEFEASNGKINSWNRPDMKDVKVLHYQEDCWFAKLGVARFCESCSDDSTKERYLATYTSEEWAALIA